MSALSLDVFSLRDAVVGEYKRFATSFTTIFADDIRTQVEAIYAENRYWPEPLVQINPSFKRSTSIGELVEGGVLDPLCAQIFRSSPTPDAPTGAPLSLYKHQEQAIGLAADGESYVVTTGTGSGKSLCFFIPIVNAALAEKAAGGGERTRAVIIYPMNALANSQLEELEKYLGNVPGPHPVTFARYTGQEDQEERERIAANPPDILLTNFMMLELLMTRQDEIDRTVIGNCAGLRFLVLDELHTYRGRQGADVAMLVRRVRELLAPEGLQCIGTSATMASEGTIDDKKQVVAGVASKLFATQIPFTNVIVEDLERVTEKTATVESVQPLLGPAIDAGIDPRISDAELKHHPLAIWVETTLGIRWSEADTRWVRARPLTVTEAVDALVAVTGREPKACRDALRDLLLRSSLPEAERRGDGQGSTRSFFPFKLHQFISGAGHAYATLDPVGSRRVTVDGQQFLPTSPEKRLFALHFCRECGQEYHPVRYVQGEGERGFLARDIDDGAAPRADGDKADADEPIDTEIFGFLTLHPPDAEFTFDDRVEDYPDTWLDHDAAGNPRVKSSYRKARAQDLRVEPGGKAGSGARAWFLPGKFRFCLRCRSPQGGASRDRTRLASLSAEGRSSATTVLVSTALRWMHGPESGLEPHTRKLLGFSDNRQDAALQAGHFNDFLFVSLVRSGFLGALEQSTGGLRSHELGLAQQRALGFDRNTPAVRGEWLQEPTLRGFHLQEAEATLREVLAYRVWFDQRRGWRYTNPNLEQLGLLEVEYLGLPELAADDALFAKAPDILRHATAAVRAAVYTVLFDHLRKWMAVRSNVLEPHVIEQMVSRSHSRLRAPWGFGADEKPRPARWLMVTPPSRKETRLRDEDLIVRGGARSSLGRSLRSPKLWGDHRVRDLKSKEVDALIKALLAAASVEGLVSEESTPFDTMGWRLNDACVRFALGTPDLESGHSNDFFRDLYGNLSRLLRDPAHPLFGFEAREHTAQVDGEKRVIREKRFRYGEKEREELANEEKRLREIGEANRFLPVLFCSPTMELGVDISALNAVYLRNVPPTPANYAQRSGRAGRSGQAALVLTYASSQGPHDQYFFRDPRAMVHGEVRAPLLDLANRDLIDSHLQAVWLACTETRLDPSIAELLVLADPERPLRVEVTEPMAQPRVAAHATERIRRVLDLVSDELTPELAPWFSARDDYADGIVSEAPQRFADAFRRWRDLFRAAELQRDAARRTMDDYAAPPGDKRAAQMRHIQALDQLGLLQKAGSTSTTDFYTYRYLATEGFLPGYNFPRLPLMAYVPATADGRGRQTYLQRPRFLALSEFGPRSLVYHEGRAFRVVRALLALGPKDASTPDTRLPTKTLRICKGCGAGHADEHTSLCVGCGAALGKAEIVRDVFRIENVATQPAERISANDEERQRQGFELQTTFAWAVRGDAVDVRKGRASDVGGDIVRLAYGPGATITRLNKGLRRRKDKAVLGFLIDPVYGYWAKNDEDDEAPVDPTAVPRQRIVPSVEDRKNALLVQPNLPEQALSMERPDEALRRRSTTLATVQHALLRGVESVFQLEQGEILAEPVPTAADRNGFLLYEAAEGGAGVLTRLVAEPDRLAEVAVRALQILHFTDDLPANGDALGDRPDTACVAACYRCVMSYYNQPDHELLDRRDATARQILLRLARSVTTGLGQPAAPPGDRPHREDAGLGAWLERLAALSLPKPDPEPLRAGDVSFALAWKEHYVVAALDAPPDAVQTALANKDIALVIFADPSTWDARFTELATALGH